MRKFIMCSVVLAFVSTASFAKDINAWKNEKNLKQQYIAFKENLNFWNGNYFLDERQLNDFYTALSDSVTILKVEIANKKGKINDLQNELNLTGAQLENIKAGLEKSIKNQKTIQVFGVNIHKSIYTLFMSLIILGLFGFTSIIYQLYKKGGKVTAKARQDYEELKAEFESHKKYALDRYTKLNAELHHARMELKRR